MSLPCPAVTDLFEVYVTHAMHAVRTLPSLAFSVTVIAALQGACESTGRVSSQDEPQGCQHPEGPICPQQSHL